MKKDNIQPIVKKESVKGKEAKEKSKAIGRSGINIRLASMLTGLNIELVENDQVTNEDGEIEEAKDGVDALEALFN